MGIIIPTDQYFSEGLKPPTSNGAMQLIANGFYGLVFRCVTREVYRAVLKEPAGTAERVVDLLHT